MSSERRHLSGVPGELPPARREKTGDLSPAEEKRRLVRSIAADPVKIDWLREHGAKLLEREAYRLAELGDAEGADELHRRAAAHRKGETSLW